jgi:ribosomal protein L25 (general stress protein Ctc)
MEVVIKYRRTDNSVQTSHHLSLVIDKQKGTVLCTAVQFGKYKLRVEHTFADNGRVHQ